MRSLGMVLIIAVGVAMLQGCAMPTWQSSDAKEVGRSSSIEERMEDGTRKRAQAPVGDEMVLRYLEQQMKPGTTLRFR